MDTDRLDLIDPEKLGKGFHFYELCLKGHFNFKKSWFEPDRYGSLGTDTTIRE